MYLFILHNNHIPPIMQFNITLFHTALQLLRHLEHKSEFKFTTGTHLTLTSDLLGVSYRDLGENCLRYSSIAFYKILITPFRSPFLCGTQNTLETHIHDDIMTWKWFPCYCPNAVTIGFPPQMASKPGALLFSLLLA